MVKKSVVAAVAAVVLMGGPLAAAPASAAATPGGRLWVSDGTGYSLVTSGPIAANTTPSIAAPSSGPLQQIAWQGVNNLLFTTGPSGPIDLGVVMSDNTSPSLAELGVDRWFPNGGWAIAFQGGDHNLWFDTSQNGPTDTHLPMEPGTSPAIAALTNGGSFQVVWHGANGDLWTTADHPTDTGVAMWPGTSPSLTELGGFHEEVAVDGANGHLWIYGSNNPGDTNQSMAGGTNPAVISYGTGFLIAYHGVDGNLISTGVFDDERLEEGTSEWFLPMVPGTSPSLVNEHHIPLMAFQLNAANSGPVGEVVTFDPTDGDLDVDHTGGVAAVNTGTSISELRDGTFKIAFQWDN